MMFAKLLKRTPPSVGTRRMVPHGRRCSLEWNHWFRLVAAGRERGSGPISRSLGEWVFPLFPRPAPAIQLASVWHEHVSEPCKPPAPRQPRGALAPPASVAPAGGRGRQQRVLRARR